MNADDTPRRILVVRLADLGDVLLAEPSIRSLRTAFPEAQIDLLVPPASAEIGRMIAPDATLVPFSKATFDRPESLLKPRAFVDVAHLALRLRRAKYDRVVLLHHLTTAMGARKFRALALATGSRVIAGIDNGRGTFLTHPVDDLGFGARHEVEYALDVAIAAGGASVDRRPQLDYASATKTVSTPASYVALYPATGPYSPARTWAIEGFIDVARQLISQGEGVVVLGGNDARALGAQIARAVPDALNLTGQTSLDQLTTVVRDARAVVGGDSFIAHLADALGRPLVTIFGPSNVDAWRPVSAVRVSSHQRMPHARAIALVAGVPCSPCLYTGFSLGRRMGCPTRTCLSMVTPARVIGALDAVLATETP